MTDGHRDHCQWWHCTLDATGPATSVFTAILLLLYFKLSGCNFCAL
jgi:hypothetical protein